MMQGFKVKIYKKWFVGIFVCLHEGMYARDSLDEPDSVCCIWWGKSHPHYVEEEWQGVVGVDPTCIGGSVYKGRLG